jgi:hypothetical protein
MVFACGDVKCKDMTSSPLRTYGAPERIEKINKEITSLEKNEKDEKSMIRLGDLHEQLRLYYWKWKIMILPLLISTSLCI